MGVEVRSHKGPEKPLMDFPVVKVKIEELTPHEQTIPTELDWFIESVRDSDVLIWPMIIGDEHYIILDGHHRAEGLRRLNYKEAPAILIDYSDDDLVKLDTWYPLVNFPVDEVIDHLQKLDLDIEEIDPTKFSRAALNDREITAFVGNSTKLYQVIGDRETIFRELRDNWLANITYYDDADMCFEKSNPSHTALVSWAYTKEEIIEQVNNGVVHLPKTTRHTLKYRVPKCNFPLSELERNE